MSLFALLALCFLQEPVAPESAEQEPVAPESAEQEPGKDPITMQDMEKAIAAVTERFAEVDILLNKTVEGISDAADQPEAPLAEDASIGAAADAAAQLVADMEHLLEVLPAPPQQPNDGSGSGGEPQEGMPSQPSDPSRDPQGNQNDGSPQPQESQNGQAPPPEMPLRSVLRDPRAGQWGNLPPRLQQAIDNASADDLPLRYRRWLVEYHRNGSDN